MLGLLCLCQMVLVNTRFDQRIFSIASNESFCQRKLSQNLQQFTNDFVLIALKTVSNRENLAV